MPKTIRPFFCTLKNIGFMFGTTKKTTANSTSSTDLGGGDQTCVIAKGTTIEGKFFCTENVRLDGAINGQIKVDKRLVMGETGLVDGNITALNCAVKGKVHGDITVKEQLHLLETAYIDGNIQATSMIVDEGARHNGRSSIGAVK